MNQRERYKTPWAPLLWLCCWGLDTCAAPPRPPACPPVTPAPPALVPSVSHSSYLASCPSASDRPGDSSPASLQSNLPGFESESSGPDPGKGHSTPVPIS